jgi:hypothetical protein
MTFGGGTYCQRVLALEESGPGRVEPVLVVDLLLLLSLLKRLFADLLVLVDDNVQFFLVDYALIHQLLRVDFEDVLVLLDDARKYLFDKYLFSVRSFT